MFNFGVLLTNFNNFSRASVTFMYEEISPRVIIRTPATERAKILTERKQKKLHQHSHIIKSTIIHCTQKLAELLHPVLWIRIRLACAPFGSRIRIHIRIKKVGSGSASKSKARSGSASKSKLRSCGGLKWSHTGQRTFTMEAWRTIMVWRVSAGQCS